jgi:hypothetical protein
VAVYVGGAWAIFGGTSVGAPLVAAIFALADNATAPGHVYGHRGALFDVTSGANGKCSKKKAYLCSAQTGYDAPTGLGSPNGLGAF